MHVLDLHAVNQSCSFQTIISTTHFVALLQPLENGMCVQVFLRSYFRN
jgi:hypothetical protein